MSVNKFRPREPGGRPVADYRYWLRNATILIGRRSLCGRNDPHLVQRFYQGERFGELFVYRHLHTTILKRFCGSYTLISAQDSGFGVSEVEYAYQLMIKNAERNQQMLSELQNVEGLENISLTMQEKLLEV